MSDLAERALEPLAASLDEPGGERGGTAQRHLLAQHGANRELLPVDVRRARAVPGAPRTSGPSSGSAPSTSLTLYGSESRSSRARERCIAAARSRRSASQKRAWTWPSPGRSSTRAGAVRQSQAAAVGAVEHLLHARHRAAVPEKR